MPVIMYLAKLTGAITAQIILQAAILALFTIIVRKLPDEKSEEENK